MLACGTSIVKLGNCILTDRNQPPRFILVSIYQTPSQAKIYILYQDGNKVSHWLSSNHMRLTNSHQIHQMEGPALNLETMAGPFEFTRRLYKLAKIFKSDDENTFREHSFAKGLAAYVQTDHFDGTLYGGQNPKKCKTDTGNSPGGGGGPTGSGFTVQGYKLVSDIIQNDQDILEPLYKVWVALLTRNTTN